MARAAPDPGPPRRRSRHPPGLVCSRRVSEGARDSHALARDRAPGGSRLGRRCGALDRASGGRSRGSRRRFRRRHARGAHDEPSRAGRHGRVAGSRARSSRGPLARHRLRGLALEPNGGTLLTLDLDASALVQLDAGGRPTASAGVSGAGLADPRAIVVAPSGDQTDDPGTQSVYVADPGGDGADHGHVIELGLAPLPLAAGEATPLAVQATLVKVTQTSKYLPPSPDPSGLAYDPGTRRLIISDGE